jgi:hypothetical protein
MTVHSSAASPPHSAERLRLSVVSNFMNSEATPLPSGPEA